MIGLRLNKYNKNIPAKTFVKDSNQLDSTLSYSRSGDAFFENSLGILEQVGANIPRFDYSPIKAGILIEDQSVNQITSPTNFIGSGWSNLGFRLNISTNSEIAPNNTLTADRLIVNFTSECRIDKTVSILSGESYEASVFVKDISNGWVHFLFFDGSGNGVRQWFDISNKIVGTEIPFGTGYSIDSAKIESINGYYRISAIFTAPATVSSFTFGIGVPSGDGLVSSIITQRIAAWGVKFAQGNLVSSYNEGTRSPDVLKTSNVSWFTPATTGVTIICEFTSNQPKVLNNDTLFSISDGTTDNRIEVFGMENQIDMITGGVSQVNINGTDNTMGVITKIGVSISGSDLIFVTNGVHNGTDSSFTLPSGLDKFNIGSNYVDGEQLNHVNHKFSIYNKAFTQQQLIDKTT